MTTQTTAAQERLHALDGLRAVMMVPGIVLHALCSYTVTDLGAAWLYKDPATPIAVDVIVLFIHQFRMPVFFVLAGFSGALLHARRGALELSRNRGQRIAIPFVLFLLLIWPPVISGFRFANASKMGTAESAWNILLPSFSDLAFYVPGTTLHLRFIYHLIQYYLIALLLAWLLRTMPAAVHVIHKVFSALLSQHWLRLAVPIALTTLTLLTMDGTLATSTAFTPAPAVMIASLVFFGFSWLLYAERHRLETLCTSPWLKILLATVVFAAVEFYLDAPAREAELGSFTILLRSAMGGTVAWLMFYGVTGLFLRYLQRPSASVRWIVDAALAPIGCLCTHP